MRVKSGFYAVAAGCSALAALILLTTSQLSADGAEAGRAELLSGHGVRARQANALRSLASQPHRAQEGADPGFQELQAELASGKYKNPFDPSVDLQQLSSYAGYDGLLPHKVAYECGGYHSAVGCVKQTKHCLMLGERFVKYHYKRSSKAGREARTETLCKCFQTSTCPAGCKVAMYTVWSTYSKVSCPASSPEYLDHVGAYRYGNGDYIKPSEISHDYFPNFPHPAGHYYTADNSMDTFKQDRRTWNIQPSPYSFYHTYPYWDNAEKWTLDRYKKNMDYLSYPDGYPYYNSVDGVRYPVTSSSYWDWMSPYTSSWSRFARNAYPYYGYNYNPVYSETVPTMESHKSASLPSWFTGSTYPFMFKSGYGYDDVSKQLFM